jgi:UPF0271 protein
LLSIVSSANIACGFHAGDPSIMRRVCGLAVERGVRIGAHVGYRALAGFGRREMEIGADEAHALTLYQVGALAAFASAAGARLGHVKPHGALYAMAARDAALAAAIAAAVREFDAELVLVGLAGSALPRAGRAAGLGVAHEAFADRAYAADGSLVPRREAGAVIGDVEAMVAQALSIATRGEVAVVGGGVRALCADTLCVHGDRPNAADFARRLREALQAAGVEVRGLGVAAYATPASRSASDRGAGA